LSHQTIIFSKIQIFTRISTWQCLFSVLHTYRICLQHRGHIKSLHLYTINMILYQNPLKNENESKLLIYPSRCRA